MGTNYYLCPKNHAKDYSKVAKILKIEFVQGNLGISSINYKSIENHLNNIARDDYPDQYGIHIGKSSMGWKFTFHATDEIRSFKQWKEKISDDKNYEILDEYGDGISDRIFYSLVDQKQKDESKDHFHDVTRLSTDECFLDDEGFIFCTGEFS